MDEGCVRNIGVSNWSCELLEETLGYARIRPSLNQVGAAEKSRCLG